MQPFIIASHYAMEETIGGIVHPLKPRRIKLPYIQQLASELNLPTRDDLEIIYGKLKKMIMNYPTNIQVVITSSEVYRRKVSCKRSTTFYYSVPTDSRMEEEPDSLYL